MRRARAPPPRRRSVPRKGWGITIDNNDDDDDDDNNRNSNSNGNSSR